MTNYQVSEEVTRIEEVGTDYMRPRPGMVKLLKTVRDAGDYGIPTRMMAWDAFKSRGDYEALLGTLEKDGYIRREKEPAPKNRNGKRHVGRPSILNIITPKGELLLSILDHLNS
jgi:hypothetical protein